MKNLHREIIRCLIRTDARRLLASNILPTILFILHFYRNRQQIRRNESLSIIMSVSARSILCRITKTLRVRAMNKCARNSALYHLDSGNRLRALGSVPCHILTGILTSRTYNVIMQRLRRDVISSTEMRILSIRARLTTQRLLNWSHYLLRDVSRAVKICTSLRTMTNINTRPIAADALTSRHKIRMNYLRRGVAYHLVYTQTAATRSADGARHLNNITSNRIAVTRNILRAIRNSRKYAHQRHPSCSLLPHRRVNVRTIRELAMNMRGVVNSISSIVSQSRPRDYRTLLRPHEAILRHTIHRQRHRVTLTDDDVNCLRNSLWIIIIRDGNATIKTVRENLVTVLPRPNMRIADRAMIQRHVNAIHHRIRLGRPIALWIRMLHHEDTCCDVI